MPAPSSDDAVGQPEPQDPPSHEHERVARELQDVANRAPAAPPAPHRRWWEVWKRA
jgi:hypothetical protein